ncbi:MAG: hypothetical protein LBI53_07610 [Candidatus Peribacteria bacterium]|nr:hypothetical protein [Candidatus Peribacteria bacterium]
MIILALIIIRIILLLMNIDILPNSLKKIINQGFNKQPEELTAYLT